MATRYASFLAAIAMLLASGVLYHLLAQDTEQLDVAAARIELVPLVVGDWIGQDDTTDHAAFAQTGAKGYWARQYVNQKSKASVLVILMCGRAGKMAVHTPEVCYSGAGYAMNGEPTAISIKDARDESNAQFWSAQFAKKAGKLRLYWGWNAHGSWEAASSPRWQFRGEPFLYKLYVSHELGEQKADAKQVDVTVEFLQVFVPELRQTLFPLAGN